MDHTTLAVGTVCEVGPVEVRHLRSGSGESVPPDPRLTAAALDGDDPMVLVGARPMALREVWRALLEPLLRSDEPALLVHPSWWPGPRIDNVRAVAQRLSADVITSPRSWLLATIAGDAPVVEIGPQIVTVTVDGAVPSGIPRRARAPSDVADSIVRTVLRESERGPVWLDAPAGVPGAGALAAQIAERLKAVNRAVHRVGDRQLLSAAAVVMEFDEAQPIAQPRRTHRRLLNCAAAATAAAIAAVGLWTGAGGGAAVDTAAVATTALVEGHVTMQIPADWAIRRIMMGPGSARVEAISPGDAEMVLHLTQASVRDDSLVAAAATLRRAIDAEPAGIFIDFHPTDERAGRAAITYREIRPGHEIRWAVVVDGNMRIGIGCQTGAASDDVTTACKDAVRSAHQIG